MMNSLLKILKVSRPISWVNTAYPFAAGYLVLGGKINTLFVLSTLFFLIPYNILMYGINDVFDYESDIQNPRKGSIEGAVESKAFHPTIIAASIISTLPFIIAILLMISWQAALTLTIVLFFVVAYSVKGLRFKEVPILDSITSSCHFSGPLVFACAVLGFPAAAWPVVAAFFLWGIASHSLGAIQDIIPDRKGNLQSIATIFGAQATVLISLTAYMISIILIALQGVEGVIVGLAGLLYIANIAPYLRVNDQTSARTNKAWKRFIWINYIVGAVVTMVLITTKL